MTCNKCGASLPDNSKFCVKCGNKIDVPVQPAQIRKNTQNINVCPKCGKPLNNGALFCTSCGTKISGNAAVNSADVPLNNTAVSQNGSQNIKPQQSVLNSQSIQRPQNVQRPKNAQNPQNIQKPQRPQNAQRPQNKQAVHGSGAPAVQTPKGKSKAPLIILIIAAVLLIAGGIAGFFIWQNMSGNDEDDDRSSVSEKYSEEVSETTTAVAATTAPTETTEQVTSATTRIKEVKADFGLLGRSFATLVSVYGEPEQVVPSPTPDDAYIAYKYGKIFFYSDKWFSGGAVERTTDVVTKIAVEEGAMLNKEISTDNMMKYVDTYESLSGTGGSAGLTPVGKGVITIDGMKLSFDVKEKNGNDKFDGNTLYEFVKYEKPTETVPPTTVQEDIMPFTLSKKGQINCHGGTVPGYTTSYVTGEGGDTYVRHSLGDTWHVTAKSCCIINGITWYELWDSDDGDYYGWVDSRNIDFY